MIVERPKPEPPAPQLPPISLFGDATAGVPEPKALGEIYAPYGRLIPCETVITVDSASIQTPIVGLITENIYHAGKLVIPAGTEVHGTAQTDRHRERIASGGSWTLVWQGGEELRLKGVALDREFSGDQEGWGITDGSAGLRGRLIKSDNLAEIKLFAATFLSGAASALTEKEQTIFGSVDSRSLNNAPFKGGKALHYEGGIRVPLVFRLPGRVPRHDDGSEFFPPLPDSERAHGAWTAAATAGVSFWSSPWRSRAATTAGWGNLGALPKPPWVRSYSAR